MVSIELPFSMGMTEMESAELPFSMTFFFHRNNEMESAGL